MSTATAPDAAIPPTKQHRVPLAVIARIAATGRRDGLARCLVAVMAVGETHATICRTERCGIQLGSRFIVRFDVSLAKLKALVPRADLDDFDRHVDTGNVCQVIDGTPEGCGVVLPYREPKRRFWSPWFK